METIDRVMAERISKEIVTACEEVMERFGTSISFAGGSLRDGKAILKFSVCAVSPKGDVALSDSRLRGLKGMFSDAGITVQGEVVGSIWVHRNRGLFKIVDYHTGRKKYPFEIEFFDGATRVTSMEFFKESYQQVIPDASAMYWWLKVDPDLLSDTETKRFNMINEWLTMYVSKDWLDRFYEAVSKLIDRGVTKETAARFRETLMMDTSWEQIVSIIQTL